MQDRPVQRPIDHAIHRELLTSVDTPKEGYTPPDPVHFHDGLTQNPDRHPDEGTAAGWYFWDETGSFRYGPYPDEQAARRRLAEYVRVILGARNDVTTLPDERP